MARCLQIDFRRVAEAGDKSNELVCRNMEITPVVSVAEYELDMPRQLEAAPARLTALVINAIIWLQQDHWVLKHPRRSIDLEQQIFTPPHYDPA
ncbi:MAG: hypothetical protein ABSG46_02545 [Candidatus Binataceae bacterium]